MRYTAIIFLPIVAACGTSAPTPEQCKALAMPDAVLERCVRGDPPNDEYVGDVACWPFSPPERVQGLWLIGLETSEFWPNVSDPEQIPVSSRQIWFASSLLETDPALAAAAQGKETRVYEVDVEGRKALCDGMFGHMGVYPRQVVVDRFYAMDRLR